MRSILIAAVIFVLLAVSPTCAQSDFRSLRALPSDRVLVTQPNGVAVGGVLADVSAGELRIDRYTFAPEPGLRIDKMGDSIWSGTFIGLGVGALVSVLTDCYAVAHWHCLASAAVAYGGLGALLDAAHEGRTTIYRGSTPRAARVRPVVVPGSAQLTVAIGF